MKQIIGKLTAVAAAGVLGIFAVGCAESTTTTDNGDSEQRGGSMAGAGGAGPGFDGSGSGTGKYGTVPDSGAARQGEAGHSQTNTAMSSPSSRPAVPTPPSPQVQ